MEALAAARAAARKQLELAESVDLDQFSMALAASGVHTHPSILPEEPSWDPMVRNGQRLNKAGSMQLLSRPKSKGYVLLLA